MIRITVAGRDRGLRTAIETACGKYGVDALCGFSGEAPDILVTGRRSDGTESVSEKTVIIADTRSAALPQEMMVNGNVIIGCSGSPADTLSLACRDREKLIAGLRRSVATLSGEIAEPREICIYADESQPLFHCLAACAVLLLCGKGTDGDIRL